MEYQFSFSAIKYVILALGFT